MIQKLETHYDKPRVNYGSGVRLQYDQIRKLIQSLPGRSGTSNEYNGRILVRVPKSVHAALAHEAEQEGVSLNQLIVANQILTSAPLQYEQRMRCVNSVPSWPACRIRDANPFVC